MYLKKLIYKNVGPITSNCVDFRFTAEGKPVPVVIVGENGTGKSIFLSNIIDAFFELAGTAFQNVLQPIGDGHQYYKTISPDQIKLGENWLVAYMEFEHNAQKIEYIFKSGELSFSDFKTKESIQFDERLDWKDKYNDKKVICEKKQIEQVFEKTIVASFSPMRYEKPSWMGNMYHAHQEEVTFSHSSAINGYLYNPISVECNSETTLKWLFDVIADSRADLEKNDRNGYSIVYPSLNNIDLLSVSRKNAEQLMSAILGKDVIFRMGNRSSKGRRLLICDTKGRELVPSLDALSTGQLALFNMFSSIIRYADNDDINLSFKLNEIKGIVLIDEIELHLHSKLQREVLPKMISLFPQVQFIITSHSPLFLLGLKEELGEENIDILEMPAATKILAEDFSEFGKAYQYYSDTQLFRKQIKEEIDVSNTNNKPLVITEGSTDWKHMKAALRELKNDDRCKDWLSQLDFEFFEYEPLNSNSKTSSNKIQMNCTELARMCKSYSKMSNNRKMIFIADNDDEPTKNDLGGNPFKTWGNKVYSFCLPIPSHRSNPNVCIEHLYRDEEIKREVSFEGGIKRRIFLGSEFNNTGHIECDECLYFCKAMLNSNERTKDAIVDGSDNKKVIKLRDCNEVNYALPKTTFANYVLDKIEPFENMDFSSFIPLFEIIRDILAVNKEI